MKKHYIDIVGKWAFVFAYDIGEDDVDEMGDWLEALGAGRKGDCQGMPRDPGSE